MAQSLRLALHLRVLSRPGQGSALKHERNLICKGLEQVELFWRLQAAGLDGPYPKHPNGPPRGQ